MYNKVETNMNFVEREKATEKFWEENDIFRKSMENRKEGPTYTFYETHVYQYMCDLEYHLHNMSDAYCVDEIMLELENA